MADLTNAEEAVVLRDSRHDRAHGRGQGEYRASDQSQTEKAISFVIGNQQLQRRRVDSRGNRLEQHKSDQPVHALSISCIPIRTEPRSGHCGENSYQKNQNATSKKHQHELNRRGDRRTEREAGNDEVRIVFMQLEHAHPIVPLFGQSTFRHHVLDDPGGIPVRCDIRQIHRSDQSEDDHGQFYKLRQCRSKGFTLALDGDPEGRDHEAGERHHSDHPIKMLTK
ncbi:hypothetical protein LUW76_34600 [Actinomadura madurae]|nr:hypothetical protein LUW76_34600 [Actinomadura madurae]